jgi:hypothetical protein
VTGQEQQEFEAALRRTRPVKLPEELRSRLLAAAPPIKARSAPPWPALAVLGWLRVLRLALPAAAVVLIAAVVVWRSASPSKPKAINSTSRNWFHPLTLSQDCRAANLSVSAAINGWTKLL